VESIAAPVRHLGYAEARARVLAAVPLLPAVTVPLAAALGRPARAALRAPHPLPPFRNASMDGFAVRASDLGTATAGRPVELPVVERIAAGRVASRPLGAGEAMRIMTGAALPEGADAVIPFEDAEAGVAGGREVARIPAPPASGANIREAGADLAAGAEAVAAGRELSPHDLALLAALGVARLDVGPRPRVAVLSTGDELLRVDEPLRPGAIRDSNRPQLEALLAQSGCDVVRSENLPDDPDRLVRRVIEAFGEADAVLTVGGVSAGDFDPVKQGLSRIEGAELWRVAMKPGRPQAFGVHDGRLFYGLPGNPGSVACVFEALVRPALRKMQGHRNLDRPRIAVRAAATLDSRRGRVDFVRVTLAWEADAWWATPAGAQVSGHLTPQARAEALVVVPEQAAALERGERAEALVLRWPEPPGA
jgi:molybdopterin molybdotransferase